jgi:hypothetical protein
MDRLSEKHDFLIKLGMLFGPLKRLVESPEACDPQARAEAIAQYTFEYALLRHEFHKFSKGQPGHNYSIEWKNFNGALERVLLRLEREDLRLVVVEEIENARRAIESIPVPKMSVILAAGSPFTAHCKIRSLCEAAAARSIIWFDPYFDSTIFHRYLQFVRTGFKVTLVASEPAANAGKRNHDRWRDFVDISRLFAKDRGPNQYQLLVAASLHERWLVLDEREIYQLGGSGKDAASKDFFTIGNVDASAGNRQKIEDAIGAAAEWFGPSTPNHR